MQCNHLTKVKTSHITILDNYNNPNTLKPNFNNIDIIVYTMNLNLSQKSSFNQRTIDYIIYFIWFYFYANAGVWVS